MKALEGDYLVSSETIKTATLGPNGAYQFKEQVCSHTPCKTVNQGQGTYRAVGAARGAIFFMIRYSDAKRTNVCISDSVEFDTSQVIVMKNGEVWTKWSTKSNQ